MPRRNSAALKPRTRNRNRNAGRSYVHLLDDFGNPIDIVRLIGPSSEYPDHMVAETRTGNIIVKHMMMFTSIHRGAQS
jgi:hypothetical protein